MNEVSTGQTQFIKNTTDEYQLKIVLMFLDMCTVPAGILFEQVLHGQRVQSYGGLIIFCICMAFTHTIPT